MDLDNDSPTTTPLIIAEDVEVATRPSKKSRAETVCISYLDPILQLDLTSAPFLKLITLRTFGTMADPNFQFTPLELPSTLPELLTSASLRTGVTYGPHLSRSLQPQSLVHESSDTTSSTLNVLSESFVKNVYKGELNSLSH